MRTRAALARPMFAFLLVAMTPVLASADAWNLAPGQWATDVSGVRYSSDDFHGLTGTRGTMAGGGLEERSSLLWTGELGWKKKTSFAYSIPFDGITRRLGGGQSATETGLADLRLGLHYRIAGGNDWVVSAQATWKAPGGYSRLVGLAPNEIAALDSTVLAGMTPGDSANYVRQVARPRLGNGEQAFEGMVMYGIALPRFHSFAEFGGGYRYYRDHIQNQALLSGDIGIWLGSSLLVTGRYRGEVAMGDSRDLNTRNMEAVVNGEVLVVGQADTPADVVDQQLLGPEIRYRMDDGIDMFIGSWHTAGATNALHMDQFYAGITFKSTKLGRYQGVLGGKK